MSEDFITIEEIAPMVDCFGMAAGYVLRGVYGAIEAKANGDVKPMVQLPLINKALGLAENVPWDQTEEALRQLALMAAQAKIGQSPTSHSAQLNALSAREPTASEAFAIKGGFRRVELALALGMAENSTKAEVLAELGRGYDARHPKAAERRLTHNRMAFLGLSATPSLFVAEREELVMALCHDLPPGPKGDRQFRAAQFYVSQLSDTQIFSMRLAMLVSSRAAQSGLVLLHPAKTGGTAAAPAWTPQLQTLTAKMPAGTTISIGPSISLAKAAAH